MTKHRRRGATNSCIAALVAICTGFAVEKAHTAELGATYNSYEEMHTNSKYGALFFVSGATQKADILTTHKFTVVVGEGDVLLPSQEGYCFVVNHYSVELGYKGLTRYYRANITKQFAHSEPLSQSIRYSFLPTAEPESEQVDDVCVSHMMDVTAVAMEIHLDNAVVRAISFNQR